MFANIFEIDKHFSEECKRLQLHYEMLDIRENSTHYKTVYGVDVADEL